MAIKQQHKPFSLDGRAHEAWKPEVFIPMTEEKKEELFHELAVSYPDLSLGYIEANREIKDPETRSFWWKTDWAIVVLDSEWKYWKYNKKEFPNYQEYAKKFSADENMIWVSEDPSGKNKFWWKDGNGVVLKDWRRKIKLKLK